MSDAANIEVVERFLGAFDVGQRPSWSGELAIDAGPWPKGTTLSAWCVAHYRLDGGRIAEIEQHDCYDPAGTLEA
jgi:hypothetical protein